jgi:hypothetical protein
MRSPKRDTCVIITATRGSRSNLIVDSFYRYNTKDLEVFERVMTALVNDPRTQTIVFGGATSDNVALRYALKQKGDRPKLVVIVPARVTDQPRETWAYTNQADEVIELCQPLYDEYDKFRKAIYHVRNRAMLEYAQDFDERFVQAFWTGQRSFSGTYATMTLARRKYQMRVQVAWLGKARDRPLEASWRP